MFLAIRKLGISSWHFRASWFCVITGKSACSPLCMTITEDSVLLWQQSACLLQRSALKSNAIKGTKTSPADCGAKQSYKTAQESLQSCIETCSCSGENELQICA